MTDGARASSSDADGAVAPRAPRAQRILIVEDDLLIALDVETTLGEAGHDVVGTVMTEDAAVETALRLRPDVLLLDLRLAHGGSGRCVAERVAGRIEVALVFASGSLTPPVRADLAPLRPVALIDRPYLDAELLSAVALAA